MKKLLVLTLATISIVGYSQEAQPTTTAQEDAIAYQQARIVALDLQYKSQTNLATLQYRAQRNSMVRQLAPKTNTVSSVTNSPTSKTTSN